jgi:hypothetical protein
MNRLTLDIPALLAGIDLMPFFIVTSGIILFWVAMIWIVLFIVSRMR